MMRTRILPSRFPTPSLAVIVALVCMTGCDEVRTEYGYSYSSSGSKSINGVVAMRRMFDQRGWETAHIKRLSPRAQRHDAIVWFPTVLGAPNGKATDWFDDWLAEKPRTLVFVAYGYESCEPEYWRLARDSAPADKRLEFRRREARARNRVRFAGFGGPTSAWSNGWFTMTVDAGYSEAREFQGPWADSLDQMPDHLRSDLQLRPYDKTTDEKLIEAEYRKEYQIEFEPLLQTADSVTLAARLQSSAWPMSQVIVVNSAEALLNLQLVNELNANVAEELISDCGQPGSVAFLRTDYFGPRVSGTDEELAAGMELLTTWPLSMTTMHAVMLGFVVVLILLPIFGRPRHLPKPSSADLGDHVTALGELMQRTGESRYARERISDYFVKVRGDENGPWVIAAEAPSVAAVNPAAKVAEPVEGQSAVDAAFNGDDALEPLAEQDALNDDTDVPKTTPGEET